MANPYKVELRDITNKYIAEVDYPQDIVVQQHFCDEGTLAVKIPQYSDVYRLLPQAYGVAVSYNNAVLASGPIHAPTYTYDDNATAADIKISDYMRLLKDRRIIPSAYTGTLPGVLTFTDANKVFPATTDTSAEDALLYYANWCLGSTAQAGRQRFGFTTSASGHRGASVSLSERFTDLLAVLQRIVNAEPSLGFKIVENTDGTLTFTVFAVRDLTQSVVFSAYVDASDAGNANIISSTYTEQRPIANRVYVLAQGTGASRKIYAVEDAASIARWGLIEGTYNYSNTNSNGDLSTAAAAYLAESAKIYDFKLRVSDTQGMTYGVDYGLGDMVTAIVPQLGIAIPQIIREVHFSYNDQTGAVIEPVLATPAKRHKYSKKKTGLLDLSARVNGLESAG